MRLSAIRLAGFKSFVDKTQLSLPSNLTAVVGPNGCGKSNLIDAVRWVLGESSAKQLRGAALSDVIFNGSRTRKPVGRAMIELVFDNSDAALDGPYAQYGEIAVRRELSRDGGSQFYINGTRCRRKDVTELFLGTGLGGRSNYAIIEQGTVSRLIEAQPEELRQMLEESAGISRYKEKRRETEIRIRHTRENLARLEDILSELDERLAKLQRQAAAAERFKRYKQEQRQLRRQLLGLRWRELEHEHQVMRARLDELVQAVDAADARLKDAIVARSQTSEQAEAAVQDSQDAQGRFYEAEANLGRAAQELKHAEEMLRIRDKEAADLRAEAERLAAQHTSRSSQASQLNEQVLALQQSLADAQQELATLEAGLGDAETEAAAQGGELERLRAALQSPRTVAATEKVRLEQLARQIERSAAREAQCRQLLDSINLAELDAQMSAAEQAQAAANRALEQADVAAARGVKTVEDARGRRAEADRHLHELRKHAQSVHARVAALSAEQSRALGEDGPGDKAWLKARQWNEAKPLGRLLKVSGQWEKAVEVVLGPWLQALCVDGDVVALAAADGQPRLLLEARDGDWRAPEGTLAAEVQGPEAIRRMLARVVTAPDLAAVPAVLAAQSDGVAVVVPEGHIHWQGMARLNRDSREDGVLLRERLLTEARAEDASAQAELKAAETAQHEAQAALREAEQAQQEALRELDVARRQHAEARAVSQQLLDRRNSLAQRQEQAQRDLLESERLKAELLDERGKAQAAMEAAGAEVAALEDQERAQQTRSDAARSALAELRHRLTALQRQLESSRERRAALTSELAATEAARDALAARRADIERSLAASQQDQNRLHLPLDELKAAVESARKVRDEARERLDQVRAAQDAATQQAREAANQVLRREQDAQAARQRRQEQELSEQRLLARRDGLSEQIGEAGARIEEILGEIDEEMQARSCEEELEALEGRIQRLGAVNLAAVEEYEEEKKRADFMRIQEADLKEALDKLEDAIRQIDKETRVRFRATFEAVNDKFKTRFPRLFGGGEAYLELIGEDVLDAGVRVMARPPGKRNATIQLLSGGEKAMTAIALVFALFELNPAPFCMLDEVDAPLDDANVVRYCDVVREMSEHVQFIIVTHNKITMELANQLNGVTMQEPGVSRLVSVDVQQAVALAG